MLTITLTDTDIAILRSLFDDGRKSFRQISKEIGVTTPTVKARFNRLVDMGVIRSVSPILDLNKLRFSKVKKDDNNFKIDDLINYQEYVTQQLLQTKKILNHHLVMKLVLMSNVIIARQLLQIECIL